MRCSGSSWNLYADCCHEPDCTDEAGVPESAKQEEINVAIEKTKAEQVQKAVEAALKKAGINPSRR